MYCQAALPLGEANTFDENGSKDQYQRHIVGIQHESQELREHREFGLSIQQGDSGCFRLARSLDLRLCGHEALPIRGQQMFRANAKE